MASKLTAPWLPIGAPRTSPLKEQIEALLADGLANLSQVVKLLDAAQRSVEFDAAFAATVAVVEPRLATLTRESIATRQAVASLARLAGLALGPRWIRPLMKDRARAVRSRARGVLSFLEPSDVSLPAPDGETGWRAWSAGNVNNHGKEGLARRAAGSARRTQQRVPELVTVADLRAHLGIVSSAQLRWLLTATDQPQGDTAAPYRRFSIPKRDGRPREICAPRGTLRRVQRRIYETILKDLRVHPAAHGFVPGRSVLTNAEPHRRKAIVVKLDLVDFFPTIHYWRVVGLFASLGYEVIRGRFGFKDEHRSVAATLARLCTFTPQPSQIGEGWAPQGAPTSPAISNLVCRRLDARLSGLAARVGGVYTRYADDLTFSFDTAPEGGLGRFRWWADEILHQEGFVANHGKFRVLRASQRQRVTGLVVNDRVGISRRERRRFRAILHNCEVRGIEAERRGRADFEDWLRGYGAWIAMVHPSEGPALKRRIDTLLGTP
ncbi:MAG: reverse transcriptase family protein [Myxococcota bacterium]